MAACLGGEAAAAAGSHLLGKPVTLARPNWLRQGEREEPVGEWGIRREIAWRRRSCKRSERRIGRVTRKPWRTFAKAASGSSRRGERPAAAPISESELRRIVISDVGALLNTVNLDSAQDLSEAPQVGKSILNFGFPDIARLSIDENAVSLVARETRVGAQGL